MLLELFIRDFAIIDDLRLQLDTGFNVLTGETGAGKSIILDAVTLVLGGRADTSMIRTGSDKAYVEATFGLNPTLQSAVQPLLLEEGLEEETTDETLLVTRELRSNGRNICRINGRAVSLTLLRQVATPLIDIHGQGEHLSLLKPRSHLPLLDAYGRLVKKQQSLARAVSKLQKVQRELQSLHEDKAFLEQRLDMLTFQVEEIDAAQLQMGEEEELRQERNRLANAEHLMQATAVGIGLLGGADDESQSVIDMLGEVERALTRLVQLDESQGRLLEQVQGLTFETGELAGDLQDYQDSLEFEPGRLEFVEERLELINHLKRKYGDDIAAILAVRDEAASELDKLEHNEERLEALNVEVDEGLRKIGQLAETLSQKRQVTAEKLSSMVEKQLADLGMSGARFGVDFQIEEDQNGAYVGEYRLAFDQTGVDKVEFLISTNPGEPMKPMAKVASGGETARLMLALKTALAQVDETPTLIFDEIDQGIGGRIGDIVGQKLWGLTAVADHQVIVVTHLPQLAGYGDVHFQVRKGVNNGRTTTRVYSLDENGRVHELAAMLGTEGVHAQGGAKSILNQVHKVKSKWSKRK